MLNMAIYENLALEGGGTKGHIYIGVALELERLGVLANIKAVAGSSVGAIAALLFATGWPVSKIQERYNKLDFSSMAMGGILDKIKVPVNLMNHFGAFKGQAFYTLFQEIIKEVTGDPNTTFRQWHTLKESKPELKLKDIFVDACNLETRLNETFSHLSEHADVPIVDAVFASMKFPGFFSTHEIKNTLYIDGGTQRNCPSAAFEATQGTFNPKTLSVRLDRQDEINYYEKGIKPDKRRPANLLQAFIAILEAATNSQGFDFKNDPYKKHTIYTTTYKVGTLDFDLTEKQKADLVESGKYGVMCYFHKNHPELTAGKYDPKILAQLEKYDYPLTITDFNSFVSPRGKPCPKAESKPTTPRGKQNVRLQPANDVLNSDMVAAITPLLNAKTTVAKPPVAENTATQKDFKQLGIKI